MATFFIDKSKMPDNADLKAALGDKYSLWMQIHDYILQQYPKAIEEWFYGGVKYGWNFRMKDKKRAIAYFVPMDQFFKISFILGNKASLVAMDSIKDENILKIIKEAPVYAEGRGVQMEVTDEKMLPWIQMLVDIKIAN